MRVTLPALLLCTLAVAIALVTDRLARLRRPHGERGDLWARMVKRFCLILGPLLLLSGAAETLIPPLWLSGWHLFVDLTTALNLTLDQRYWLALAVPFLVWASLALLGVVESPGTREEARWLAGGVGFSSSRLWVLLCALPLLAVLVLAAPQLGGGSNAYPAAAWSAVLLLVLSLLGVALSAGTLPADVAEEERESGAPPSSLSPWPVCLAERGIELETVSIMPRSHEAPRRPRGQAQELARQLARRGAIAIAPELIEATSALLDCHDQEREDGPTRLVFAPDGCGQEECTTLLAELLGQRYHTTTLVVTAHDAGALREHLQRWLPMAGLVEAIGPEGEIPGAALIWVIDAEILSDRLHRQTLPIACIGLVVWWHLQEFTGVLAAELWAISRRLHRLIRAKGQHDVRTLALMRSAQHGGTQQADYVRRLLPHKLPRHSTVLVEQRYHRQVQLHLLKDHSKLFASGAADSIPEHCRHLPLVAARTSVECGWPTALETPEDVAVGEADAVLQLPVAGRVLAEQLAPGNDMAGARLCQLRAADVLSLAEIVSQGGRATAGDLPHHVGLTLPHNPYVRHLLSTLRADDQHRSCFTSWRRLVCAEAHPRIFHRHLLLALHELADTRTNLHKDFLWQEEIIRQTLDGISAEGRLDHGEVRWLGEGDRLVIDRFYDSRRLPDNQQHALDAVGNDLVVVRDSGGAHDQQGVRMRVDPERLTIQAYPHRVFLHRGQRYRIREWDSLEQVLTNRSLECRLDNIASTTWRMRTSSIYDITPTGPSARIGRGNNLTRFSVDLQYEEEVHGVIRLTPELTSGVIPQPEKTLLEPISQGFRTRALVLSLSEETSPIALLSLAQALRHVLPVHLGVEEDALEVVTLTAEVINDVETWGLAIVDLYPGGIGLIDAIHDDTTLIRQLLEWTERWLRDCPCQSDAGCQLCLRSPAAQAANSDQPPLRAQALTVLARIV